MDDDADDALPQLALLLRKSTEHTQALAAVLGGLMGVLIAKGTLHAEEVENVLGFAEGTAGTMGPHASKMLDALVEIIGTVAGAARPADPGG